MATVKKDDYQTRKNIRELREVASKRRELEKHEKTLKAKLKETREKDYENADALTFVEGGVTFGVNFEKGKRTNYLPVYDENKNITNAKVSEFTKVLPIG